MKLNQPHAILRAGEARRQLPCNVGLAGAGGTLEDDLPFVFQQALDLAEVIGVEQQFVREFLNVWRPLARELLDVWLDRGRRWRIAAEPIQ